MSRRSLKIKESKGGHKNNNPLNFYKGNTSRGMEWKIETIQTGENRGPPPFLSTLNSSSKLTEGERYPRHPFMF